MLSAETCNTVATVLVVDDAVLTRIAVAEYLRDCGFRVIEASGGLEAKIVLQHGPAIDILFADARLAGEDNGFALAQWARRHRPGLTVLLSAGLVKKAEAASHLCGRNQSPPLPASHLRERVESIQSRHGRRIRSGRNTPRAAYR